MNVRERLKEAYENVSFNADKTWTSSPSAYHKGNLELYLTEHHIQRKGLHRNRPRTVRECIPKSRLAQYSNYVYNESREMSYASSTSTSDTNFSSIRLPSEPWEMPEVSELFRWFLKNLPEDNFSRLEGCYESPLLGVNAFEDKILKIQITEDRVKNIWNKDGQFCERNAKTNQVVVNFYTSPLRNFFLFDNDFDYNHEWFRNISITRDFEQLEQLSKSFKDHNGFIAKFLAGNASAEPISTEILYSEVLQGLSPNRKSFKSDQTRILVDDAAIHQDNFTNYTILNSQRGEESLPKFSQTKFAPQKTPVYFQSDSSYPRYKYPTHQYPVESLPRHRTSLVHPFSTSYVQQTYFYSPVQTVQRWIPSNYYPTQIFTSSWFTQNQIMPSSYDVNRVLGAPGNSSKANGFEEDSQFKEEVLEVEPLEEHQVSTSVSEELEIQALEQYSNSNENFYQELERQAAEQYTSSPE